MNHWQNWVCPVIVAIALFGFLLDVVGDFIKKVRGRNE